MLKLNREQVPGLIREDASQIGAQRELTVYLNHLTQNLRGDLIGIGFHNQSVGAIECLTYGFRIDPASAGTQMDGSQHVEIGASLALHVPEKRAGVTGFQTREVVPRT